MTRPRNVLYLTPSSRFLGARRSLHALAAHLDRKRWNPIVCGQGPGDLADALDADGIPFKILKTGWWRKGKYLLWRPFAISRLASLIRREGIDLVHCNEIYPNPYAVRAASLAGMMMRRRIPVVTHMRLSVTPRMIVNYDLDRADRIIVPSVQAGNDFNVWPHKDSKVNVVYNGVDLGEFRRSRSRMEARRMIGVAHEGPLLAAIGQIGPRKGGDIILKALRQIAAEFPDVKLMFVGNSHRGQEEFEAALRAEAASPALAGRVMFFPFTNQILPYYEAADVNLLVSRDEGFGRTIIEAGAIGVPTIASRAGGIPELIEDGTTGFLVESEDAAALARAMRETLANDALLASMGEAVFRHVAQHFSIGSHVDSIMDIYDAVTPA